MIVGKLHALVQVFESGHWYSVDEEIIAQVTGGATFGCGASAGANFGDNCVDPPSPVCAWFGKITFDVEAKFQVIGYKALQETEWVNW